MNIQAELNKEQADYSTNLAKNYWDYTNFENSVKHLKEAGLNPALYYAKGGQGGSTGGGQAQGVGLPSTTPTMARIQAQGMGALSIRRRRQRLWVISYSITSHIARAFKTVHL